MKNIVLNTIGDNFAYNVWNGKATVLIKKNIEKRGMNFKALDKKWSYISPCFHTSKVKNRNILFFTASLDEIILYNTQVKMADELKKQKQKILIVENEILPHALALIKNILKIKKIKEFMLK